MGCDLKLCCIKQHNLSPNKTFAMALAVEIMEEVAREEEEMAVETGAARAGERVVVGLEARGKTH